MSWVAKDVYLYLVGAGRLYCSLGHSHMSHGHRFFCRYPYIIFLFSASCQLRKISFVVFAWLVIGIAFFIRPETMTELRDAPGEWRKETLESGFQME